MSRSRHSSSEYFGGSKMWSESSSLSWPVKSSIGEMSERTSATPCSRNHSNDSRCTAIRSGSWSTSRSLEKERRSRDAREANVTPEAQREGTIGLRARAYRDEGLNERTAGQTRLFNNVVSGMFPCKSRKEQTLTGLLAGGRIRQAPAEVKVLGGLCAENCIVVRWQQ